MIWIFIPDCLYMLHILHPIHVYNKPMIYFDNIQNRKKTNFYLQNYTAKLLLHKIYRHSQAIWNFLWWLPCIFGIGDECNICAYTTVAIEYIAILHSNDKAFAKWKLLLSTECFTDGVFLPYYLLFYFCYFFSSLLVYPIYYVIL